MMSKGKFSIDFKRDALVKITEHGYPIAEFSRCLGPSLHSLYALKRKFLKSSDPSDGVKNAEILRLKTELAHVPVERDILKKHHVFRQDRASVTGNNCRGFRSGSVTRMASQLLVYLVKKASV